MFIYICQGSPCFTKKLSNWNSEKVSLVVRGCLLVVYYRLWYFVVICWWFVVVCCRFLMVCCRCRFTNCESRVYDWVKLQVSLLLFTLLLSQKCVKDIIILYAWWVVADFHIFQIFLPPAILQEVDRVERTTYN